jgi:hypothetical protein
MRRRYPALIALAGLLALAAGCSGPQTPTSASSASSASPSATTTGPATPSTPDDIPAYHDDLTGVRWQLTQVRSPGGTVAIPASDNAWFTADDRYAVQGDDGCAFFDGTGHRSADGFTVSDVAGAGNGCVGGSRAFIAAREGFGHVLNGEHARVQLSGTQLTLTAGGYTLVFTS